MLLLVALFPIWLTHLVLCLGKLLPLLGLYEPPPIKIPTSIVNRVMDNYYFGDGTVHPGDHLLFIHELCGLFKCEGITTE